MQDFQEERSSRHVNSYHVTQGAFAGPISDVAEDGGAHEAAVDPVAMCLVAHVREPLRHVPAGATRRQLDAPGRAAQINNELMNASAPQGAANEKGANGKDAAHPAGALRTERTGEAEAAAISKNADGR